VPETGYAATLAAPIAPKTPILQRLEPRCRDDDFARGLEARWAGAAWGLARQRQVGEFEGEDTGSPIRIGVKSKKHSLGEVELGIPGPGKTLPDDGPPLEAVVEHQQIHFDDIFSNWRMRVQIGQQLERLLRTEVSPSNDVVRIICELRKRYQMKALTDAERKNIDRATQRFISVMTGRVIDGGRLLKEVHRTGIDSWDLSDQVVNSLGDTTDAVNATLAKLKQWFEALYGKIADTESSTWVQEGLEYRFKVHASAGGEEITLAASSYRSGELDWYTFDAEYVPPENSDGVTNTEEFVPSRVSFYGMPNPRWWAFEDSQTDFGNMDTAKTDLAKMMIMNFAMIYGNDWFMIPLPVEVGTITRIESLKVTDVFGVETEIPRAQSVSDDPLQVWQMYTLSKKDNPNEAGDFLFLPPTVGYSEESPPVEEVRFFRDEMANMVWAVEHTVRNGLGQPFGGFEAQVEQRARDQEAYLRKRLAELRQLKEQLLQQLGGQATGQDEETPPTHESLQTKVDELEEQIKQLQSSIASAGLAPQPETPIEVETGLPRYRLSTTVPDNWIPFVPVRHPGTDREVALRQAEMIRNEDDENPTPILPVTRLLGGINGLDSLEQLREEAVTRAGQKYQLTRQRVRWLDGKTFVWSGRKIVAGKGEGSSGLRFDKIWR